MDGEGASLEMEEREDVRSSPSISAAFGPEWQPVVHHGPVYPEGRLGFVLAVSGLARVFLQLYLHCVLIFLLKIRAISKRTLILRCYHRKGNLSYYNLVLKQKPFKVHYLNALNVECPSQFCLVVY